MSRRVVITGIGLATGLGHSAQSLWESLCEGQCALAPIAGFDASAFPVQFAAQVDEAVSVRAVVPKSYRKAIKVMCRDVELAVVGAAHAIEDARLVTKANIDNHQGTTYAPHRVGCQIGAGLIVADIDELTTAYAQSRQEDGAFSFARWGQIGMNELTPLWLLKYLPNMLACHVTIIHDCCGPSNTITCAESSGSLSIGESRRVIERGDADACFSGGAESKINPLGLLRQWFAGNMADTTAQDDAASIVRPFAPDAVGGLPGEGAAVLMVEGLDTAHKRGAPRYAEIVGFGASVGVDLSTSPPMPDRSGRGAASAIRQALSDARITADEIDAIVPMGIGSPAYDECEFNGLQMVFGQALANKPLVTTKPAIGLCGAAASAIDMAVGALCVHHQQLPARINGTDRADIDANSCDSRSAQLDHVLVCGTSFGGQNTAVVLKRIDIGRAGDG